MHTMCVTHIKSPAWIKYAKQSNHRVHSKCAPLFCSKSLIFLFDSSRILATLVCLLALSLSSLCVLFQKDIFHYLFSGFVLVVCEMIESWVCLCFFRWFHSVFVSMPMFLVKKIAFVYCSLFLYLCGTNIFRLWREKCLKF